MQTNPSFFLVISFMASCIVFLALTNGISLSLAIISFTKIRDVASVPDGDLRRESNNLYEKKILDISTKNPTWVCDTDTALSAIEKMSSLQITSLLCTRKQYIKRKIKKITGVLHMHHCLSRGIK